MTPLKARRERFRRWFVEFANGIGLRARGDLRRTGLRNVYFCFGKKVFDINVLGVIRVYFCIPVEKGRSRKINRLA